MKTISNESLHFDHFDCGSELKYNRHVLYKPIVLDVTQLLKAIAPKTPK